MWHCLRHTFASRLAMAGVDLLTIKELRRVEDAGYGHALRPLSPGRLREGVERLVPGGTSCRGARADALRWGTFGRAGGCDIRCSLAGGPEARHSRDIERSRLIGDGG
jgi:hypothetical protein